MFHPFLPILPPINVRCPQRRLQLNAQLNRFASKPQTIRVALEINEWEFKSINGS
ncbi:hypothetical protein HanXRQr2_Chr10g0438971 [Helianthus annuus]|uniref:Uncharacterized protein n=1 Tax=Helianthus annuus TaxID=4232 RepID=A0A251TNQ0_HELAN|nr:hypothetical protein HanXRQr2_Chr10g0438971 [Helianthus annuus]KAJ0883633.1 hypothetical protein HanPSC8_Chr10g0423841 [Helianthus annuus]